jgi:hypothetical protein
MTFDNTGKLDFLNDDGPTEITVDKLTLKGANGGTLTNVAMTNPFFGEPATSGDILSCNIEGVLSWIAPATSGVISITEGLNIDVSTTTPASASAPSVSVKPDLIDITSITGKNGITDNLIISKPSSNTPEPDIVSSIKFTPDGNITNEIYNPNSVSGILNTSTKLITAGLELSYNVNGVEADYSVIGKKDLYITTENDGILNLYTNADNYPIVGYSNIYLSNLDSGSGYDPAVVLEAYGTENTNNPNNTTLTLKNDGTCKLTAFDLTGTPIDATFTTNIVEADSLINVNSITGKNTIGDVLTISKNTPQTGLTDKLNTIAISNNTISNQLIQPINDTMTIYTSTTLENGGIIFIQ